MVGMDTVVVGRLVEESPAASAGIFYKILSAVPCGHEKRGNVLHDCIRTVLQYRTQTHTSFIERNIQYTRNMQQIRIGTTMKLLNPYYSVNGYRQARSKSSESSSR
jgi:hypothetical protein